MKRGYAATFAEINAQLEIVRDLVALKTSLVTRNGGDTTGRRPDGRNILEPAICTIGGTRHLCQLVLSTKALGILHNAYGCGATYPLNINSGLFFSEAIGPKNAHADDYHHLVSESLLIILDAMNQRGYLDFTCLVELGQRIQKLDANFAMTKINQPQDTIHRCFGPNSQYPYSKITLCRTTVPVVLGTSFVPFFFEKFLVAFSYLDESGKRRSTVTPPHSHPLNFETLYFTSCGPHSCVIEQEFCIIQKNGKPIIQPNGKVDPEFISKTNAGWLTGITLVPTNKHVINAANKPIMLASFESDAFLRDASIINQTDGLYRPHQVAVYEDPSGIPETLLYAINNYFGPAGRVLIFSEDGKINQQIHDHRMINKIRTSG